VPPPRSLAPEDAPDSVDVPRMDPPPSSLEAMVQSSGRVRRPEPKSNWILWLVVALVTAALTAYVMR
jgi:hypothetical protein